MQMLRKTIGDDLYRYAGRGGVRTFLRFFISVPGFRYTAVMRTAVWLKKKNAVYIPLYGLCKLLLKRLEYRFGISIPYNTKIGAGFYIGHYGGIVLNPKCRIGANCNLNHGVTIGETFGGKHPGVPTIGESVYIGPYALIIGGITIGDHVAVGAGSVVTRSFEENAVIAGNPAKKISEKGSFDYIINTVDSRPEQYR